MLSPTSDAITELDAAELSAAIHARQVSCVEVMQAYLARIATVNPVLNALVSLQPEAVLLQEAAAKDALLAKGQSQGWLHGIPQAPKDLTATAGIATTMGFKGMATNVPQHDSIMAGRMRAAGAIFVGKSNTPEFGLGSHSYNAVFGTTRNAFDTTKSAGGSSGGAAVALAAHLLPVADGSDMMGSLRNPAAWNGVYGLRPSLGRVPFGAVGTNGGVQGDVFFQQLGTEGPMARTVTDLARLLHIQAGYDARVPLSALPAEDYTVSLDTELKGRRVAWLGDLGGYLALEPALQTAQTEALKHFETLGLHVEAATLSVDLTVVWQTWLTLRGLTVAGNLAPLATNPALRAQLKPEAVWEYEQGKPYTALDIARASAVRSQLYGAMLKLFADFDFVVLPAAQCMPFEASLDYPKTIAGRSMDTYHRWMECTIYATLCGLPALAVPAGKVAGLTLGLQIIGRPRDELSLLQLGRGWEQVV